MTLSTPQHISDLDLIKAIEVMNQQSWGEDNFLTHALEYGSLQPFLASSLILKWNGVKRDFQYIYIGNDIIDASGHDSTGHYILDGGITTQRLNAIKAHQEVMESRIPGYFGGVEDVPKGYSRFDQLMLPIVENNHCEKVFVFIGYS